MFKTALADSSSSTILASVSTGKGSIFLVGILPGTTSAYLFNISLISLFIFCNSCSIPGTALAPVFLESCSALTLLFSSSTKELLSSALVILSLISESIFILSILSCT